MKYHSTYGTYDFCLVCCFFLVFVSEATKCVCCICKSVSFCSFNISLQKKKFSYNQPQECPIFFLKRKFSIYKIELIGLACFFEHLYFALTIHCDSLLH